MLYDLSGKAFHFCQKKRQKLTKWSSNHSSHLDMLQNDSYNTTFQAQVAWGRCIVALITSGGLLKTSSVLPSPRCSA